MLCRDVSDLRSKERQLVTKDATIREIHHRVKNNLQTVAALLRMQARRMTSDEARVALEDATSRVASIAIVHETLSQAFDEIVDFDRVADGLLRMVGDVSASWGGVSARREGSFGAVSADVATSLAMVVTELCQNAVEHGLADSSGEVRVVPVDRTTGTCTSRSATTAAGSRPTSTASSSRSLGLSIVSTLVAEMKGTFTLGNRTGRSGHPGRGGHPALSRGSSGLLTRRPSGTQLGGRCAARSGGSIHRIVPKGGLHGVPHPRSERLLLGLAALSAPWPPRPTAAHGCARRRGRAARPLQAAPSAEAPSKVQEPGVTVSLWEWNWRSIASECPRAGARSATTASRWRRPRTR